MVTKRHATAASTDTTEYIDRSTPPRARLCKRRLMWLLSSLNKIKSNEIGSNHISSHHITSHNTRVPIPNDWKIRQPSEVWFVWSSSLFSVRRRFVPFYYTPPPARHCTLPPIFCKANNGEWRPRTTKRNDKRGHFDLHTHHTSHYSKSMYLLSDRIQYHPETPMNTLPGILIETITTDNHL